MSRSPGTKTSCAFLYHLSSRSVNPSTIYLLPNFVDFVDGVTHTKTVGLNDIGLVYAHHVATNKVTYSLYCVDMPTTLYSKFHRNPFRGFGATGGRKLAIPIALAIGCYNSLYYRTRRDNNNTIYNSAASSITIMNFTRLSVNESVTLYVTAWLAGR